MSDIYRIANIIYGAPFSSKCFNKKKKGKPIIRIRDLKNQRLDTYTDEALPNAYMVQPGDIVVGMDGEFRAYLWGSAEGDLNQRVCVFQNKRPHGVCFLHLSLKPLLNHIEQTEMATTVIHIGKQDFDSFLLLLPLASVLDEFDELTYPLYQQIVSLFLENRNLGALRDTLLPRLMGGQSDPAPLKMMSMAD